MWVTAIIVLLAAPAVAQNELPREVLDLSRIKLKMRENLDRLPDYTCLETVERSHRAAGAAFRPVDMVRVEVTRIGDKEFYSWPGSLENYSNPRPHFIVGLEFLEIEFENKRAIFSGRLDQIDPLPGLSWVLSSKRAHMASNSMPGGAGATQIMEGETLTTAELPGVGTFFLEGTHFRLPEGLHMVWRTVDLKAPGPQR